MHTTKARRVSAWCDAEKLIHCLLGGAKGRMGPAYTTPLSASAPMTSRLPSRPNSLASSCCSVAYRKLPTLAPEKDRQPETDSSTRQFMLFCLRVSDVRRYQQETPLSREHLRRGSLVNRGRGRTGSDMVMWHMYLWSLSPGPGLSSSQSTDRWWWGWRRTTEQRRHLRHTRGETSKPSPWTL